MSEDIANIEADIEALFAALELAGVAADRARRDALRLARWVSQDPPRTRAEWEQRAELRDGQGKELGYLDTSKARRIDLSDTSGAGDRDVPAQKPPAPASTNAEQGPRPLVEIEGQFFEVTGSKGPGVPEQVRPISAQEAQARIQEHRPDLSTRMVGETDARLEVTRAQRASAATTQGVAAAASPSESQDPVAGRPWVRDRAQMAGVVAVTDAWEGPHTRHDGVRALEPEISAQRASLVLSRPGAAERDVQIELHRVDGTVHVRNRAGETMSSVGAGRVLGVSSDRARELIQDAGTALKAGGAAYDARVPPPPGPVAPAARTESVQATPAPAATDRTTPVTTAQKVSDAQGQSAAEAFGASDTAKAAGRRPGAAPSGGAPDTAEIVAMGTRPAGATAHR